MRSNFFQKIKVKTAIKIIDVSMAIIFIAFWGTIAFFTVLNYVEREYLYPLNFNDLVIEYADDYGLDRAFVFAVINVESRFDKNAVSSAGAVGLMQITPNTGEYVSKLLNAKEYDLLNERTNVEFGCFYYKYLFDKFEEFDTVVCAYNAGEGNVRNWLKNSEYSLNGRTLISIPFKETKDYLNKIHKSYEKYTQLYQNILDKR